MGHVHRSNEDRHEYRIETLQLKYCTQEAVTNSFNSNTTFHWPSVFILQMIKYILIISNIAKIF